jgi:hypothetical protein
MSARIDYIAHFSLSGKSLNSTKIENTKTFYVATINGMPLESTFFTSLKKTVKAVNELSMFKERKPIPYSTVAKSLQETGAFSRNEISIFPMYIDLLTSLGFSK